METEKKEKTGYMKVAELLSRQIKENVYPPGGKLPSMKELAEKFHVCDSTIKNAFKILRKEKFLRYHYGVGMIVREDLKFPLKIALILPHDYENLNALLLGMQDALKDSCGRFEVMFYKDAAGQEQCLKRLRDEGFSGAVLRPDLSSNGCGAVRKLQDEAFPVVLIENFHPESNGWHVDAGAAEAVETAVKHLKKMGRLPIALVCSPDNFGLAFIEGYKKAHTELGVACHRCNICILEGGTAPGEASMQFMKLKEPSRSIIFMNPHDAIAGYKAIRGNTGNPKWMAIVSFGTVPNSELIEGTIFSINRDLGELGGKAATLLLEQIRKPKNERLRGQTVKVRPCPLMENI